MNELNSKQNKQTRNQILVFAVYFLLLSTPAACFNNVVIYLHEKYKHHGYGQAFLTAQSIACLIGFFISPLVFKKLSLSVKKILAYCTLLCTFYCFIPAIFTMIEEMEPEEGLRPPPSSLRFILEITANSLSGFAFSLSGILEGVGLAHICENIPDDSKGKFFSLYSGSSMIRNVLAPFVTYLSLGLGSETIFYFTLAIITLSSLLSLIFLDFKEDYKIAENDQNRTSQICFSLFSGYWNYLKMMRHLFLSFLVLGLMMGFVSGSLSHLLPKSKDPEENDKRIGMALFWFGLGAIGGSSISGFIVDRYKQKKSGIISSILLILTLLSQLGCLSTRHTMIGASCVAFLYGFSLSFCNCYFMIIITIYYNASTESFSIYRQIRTIFYISYQWIVSYIGSHYQMQLSMILEAIFLIGLILLSAIFMNLIKQIQKQKGVTLVQEIDSKSNGTDFQLQENK